MNKSICILFAVGLLACSKNELPPGSDLMKFNSEIWLKKDSIRPGSEGEIYSLREKMLADLVNNILPGKNKEEIEKLLGKSLETGYFKSVDKDLIYYMGPERDSYFGNIDSEWLLIWLDENDVFAKYQLAND